jgi:hypothetical protein
MHLKNAIEFFRLVTIQAENKLSLRGSLRSWCLVAGRVEAIINLSPQPAATRE